MMTKMTRDDVTASLVMSSITSLIVSPFPNANRILKSNTDLFYSFYKYIEMRLSDIGFLRLLQFFSKLKWTFPVFYMSPPNKCFRPFFACLFLIFHDLVRHLCLFFKLLCSHGDISMILFSFLNFINCGYKTLDSSLLLFNFLTHHPFGL